MTTIDRARLAQALERDTPLDITAFFKIHGDIENRQEAFKAFSYWRALKQAFPDATLWRIRDISEEGE